ncbi:MBL fold metallo-hydrolase [Mucilaginibacter arboris]|uniref:MBL fold metallo-hydrolase n=1 Tax=Mucilaginibacter arboris TaxID=2682090 RepID=A0A7K1SS10_9SPHI|nr:MBL fold metallo-hydrolase [Mucilaginibacter arboris]MVN20081.1 MBL fold metallo-hydrolase [Mucilaginibacter arboris]
MLHIKSFPNNPYYENTYLLFDDTLECVLIDPGMYSAEEQNKVVAFIQKNQLKPVLLLNTHCHIDHVLGNKFIFEQYGLKPQFHEGELPLLAAVPGYAPQMGIRYDVSPLPDTFLPESGTIKFGDTELELIFAPGHSPAHLCFYSANDHILIGGDVLFRESIGRTDLPGGNTGQLIQNIREKLFTLPDLVIVYPGHGPETTIGYEKEYNPFLT